MTSGPKSPPADENPALPSVIGTPGEPIRILSLSGGGLSTAMQLGVVHALLVARRRAPDMVIGSSAGSIHAVALAEIYQAGRGLSGAARWAARTAKFRELHRAFLDAPGELLQKYTPDPLQVRIEKPLRPQDRPVLTKLERDHRASAVGSRAGFMNLYDTILRMRVPISDIVLAIRRCLGIRQAANLPGKRHRWPAVIAEGFQLWILVGRNLWRIAPLVEPALKAAPIGDSTNTNGSTAAGILFRSRAWGAIWEGIKRVCGFAALGVIWSTVNIIGIRILGESTALVLAVIPGPTPHWSVGLGVFALVSSAAVGFGSSDPARTACCRSLRAWFSFILMTAAWWAGGSLVYTLAFWTLDFLKTRRRPDALEFLWIHQVSWACVAAVCLLLVATALGTLLSSGLLRRLFDTFSLRNGLFDIHPIRELLIRTFDPHYYGELEADKVIDNALSDRPRRKPDPTKPRRPRTLGAYSASRADPPIHVAATAADIASGEVIVLDREVPVVDGLIAGLSVVPLFPAVKLQNPTEPGTGRYVIDGANISPHPTRPLFSYLRERVRLHAQASALHIFNVAPYPYSKSKGLGYQGLGAKSNGDGLIEIALRALELQRFRDSRLEHQLTELLTRSLPREVGLSVELPPAGDGSKGRTLFRAHVFPIEPDHPLRVNERFLVEASGAKRREIVAEAVAEGCRSTLEAIIDPADFPKPGAHTACWNLVGAALGSDPGHSLAGAPRKQDGSTDLVGPGLPEVCAHCVLNARSSAGRPTAPLPRSVRIPERAAESPAPGTWPGEEPKVASKGLPRGWNPKVAPVAKSPDPTSPHWPRGGKEARTRRTVSLLFSGGVFRGVFQVGVLSALHQLRVAPDLVAGASVGALTAAMATSILDPSAPEKARSRRLLNVASAFLGLDRLVITDRFSDFIRGFTIRAGNAKFSLHEIDRVFRRYDTGSGSHFGRDVRSVLAGLERLTYMTPLEQIRVVEALKRRRYATAVRLLRGDAQNWLDRAGVGLEVLGAEPLEFLITAFVLESLEDPSATAETTEEVTRKPSFESGFVFLATSTNLTAGRLEVFGADQLSPQAAAPVRLETLLASSAFPGVFRPRKANEVHPATSSRDLYIDGGVTDNLPLDAVAEFLHDAAKQGVINSRPDAPHRLICASLETDSGRLQPGASLHEAAESWPTLLKRAKSLGYNAKIRNYKDAQANIQRIMAWRKQQHLDPARGTDWIPLNLKVESIVPDWLCGTFAFHPMMGFSRVKQAKSIAHGCRKTLEALDPDGGGAPRANSPGGGSPADRSGPARGGACHVLPALTCPFSGVDAAAQETGVKENLRLIYEHCPHSSSP